MTVPAEIIVDDVDDDVRKAMAELRGEATDVTPVDDNDEQDAGDIAGGDVGGGDEAPKSSSNRDATGRFVKKSNGAAQESSTGVGGTDGTGGAPQAEADGKSQSQLPDAGAPPPSWSVKSKAGWEQLPDHVRADIAKREAEMANGLQGLRDFSDLKPFAEMAKQHNTTIAKALDNYIRIENVCRQDLGLGLAHIAQNAGLNQQQAAQLFSTIAQRLGGVAAPQQANAQPGVTQHDGDPVADLLRPLLQPLQQEIGQIKNSFAHQQSAAQQQAIGAALQQFAADPANRFINDLEESMIRLFQTGMVPLTGNHAADLRSAYDMAARLNPQVQEALIEQRLQTEAESKRKREQEAADKAKAASRSMSGSRVPGTVVKDVTEGNDDPDDIEADVRRAYKQLSMA